MLVMAKSSSARLPAILCLLIVIVLVVLGSGTTAFSQGGPTPTSDQGLELAIQGAVGGYRAATGRSAASNGMVTTVFRRHGDWAFGIVGVKGGPQDTAGLDSYLVIASYTPKGWQVAVESSALFLTWLRQAPDDLVSPLEKRLLDPASPK